jgi:AmmeMemoRadiSam system protein A
VKTGQVLPIPAGLPEQLLNSKAGAFVSLHKEGRLRGCIGTIVPATENIAMEIIKNAVSAGLSDSRFEPIKASDLPLLTYKVDVLSAPEPISGPEDVDVKRYGVIVSSGYKRGLLLPNLEGIDTVEEQVSIARKKGGIAGDAPVKLERFEVTRHE